MSRAWGLGRLVLVVILASLVLSGCIFRINGYTIDCYGFSINIGYFQPTVDNSGAGEEVVLVAAVDGAGNPLIDTIAALPPLPLMSFPPEGDPFWAMFAGMMPPIPWEHAPQYNPITLTFHNPAGGVLAQDSVLLTLTGECPGLPYRQGSGIDDGRLNRLDVAAPVAVYTISYGNGVGLHIYAIGAAGTGTLALVVTPEMIAAVPAVPAENTLIAASPDGAIALYRLTTGEFQVNAGTYVIVFRDLIPTAEYYIP